MIFQRAVKRLRLLPFAGAGLLFLANCGDVQNGSVSRAEAEAARLEYAVQEVQYLQSKGRRVWCVPFARNASGIEIFGNAKTWWAQAKDQFTRSQEPQPGAVMAFSATRSNPLGHVAVVSKVEESRRIRVNHANWHRNKISLGMAVVDVSEKNDWSAVRLESYPGAFGRVYPVKGFITAEPGNG
ncbi:CHAP domain-containing protein [Leisingera aquaemixtae]|uniref:CHAP domain-containing protein n=1 Tax=Leisingera aquaemixtae TaxID=1396826 RepID=UPI001C9497F9|nr:CHAP domain-containing protein [Leisingera aquaemixtae]MBY6065375.1 CHAP domain-containing protein [Leisingera aquaemixtae]